MKKYFLLYIAVLTIFSASAFSITGVPGARVQASTLYIGLGNKGEKLSLLELSKISIKDYERISGKDLNFITKFVFKISQKKLRRNINADGSINTKTVKKYYSDADHSTGFHIGGFLLGLTIIGVAFAYLLPAADEDTKANRVKWAWRGALFTAGILSAIVASGNF